MKFENKIRFPHDTEQKIRLTLAEARAKMQTLTSGIYDDQKKTEIKENPQDEKESPPK